jgi:nucleoside-diphosphate-sugar epimerase
MKIVLAGATGAVGKRLVPRLVRSGHQVVATTRRAEKVEALRAAGAEAVVVDALDRQAVMDAVTSARPDVVVHQMSALTGMLNLKKFDQEFALTNRLRTEGTAHLLAASAAAGVRRFIAQSYTGWNNAREGGRVKTEDDPLDAHPPQAMTQTIAAIRQLEAMVLQAAQPAAQSAGAAVSGRAAVSDRVSTPAGTGSAGSAASTAGATGAIATARADSGMVGILLRYGSLYGPGTSIAPGGAIVEAVRRRKLPIVGDGAGIWSFIHIDDIAEATRVAIERGPSGIYNIVDDDPAEVSVWLPELARAIGAKAPYHVPAWVGRLAIGEPGVSMMTKIRGASNAKAKRVLGWQPSYASWRDGFREWSR